jgi:putative transposase
MLKRERIDRRRYRTVADARADAFDCIERVHDLYSQRRLDSLNEGRSALTHPSANTG